MFSLRAVKYFETCQVCKRMIIVDVWSKSPISITFRVITDLLKPMSCKSGFPNIIFFSKYWEKFLRKGKITFLKYNILWCNFWSNLSIQKSVVSTSLWDIKRKKYILQFCKTIIHFNQNQNKLLYTNWLKVKTHN